MCSTLTWLDTLQNLSPLDNIAYKGLMVIPLTDALAISTPMHGSGAGPPPLPPLEPILDPGNWYIYTE